MKVMGTGILTTPLDAAGITELVRKDTSGAVVTFEGRVRNHADGKGVTGIEYVGHPDADKVIAEAAEEIAERHPDCYVAVYHRVGVLGIGDHAMVAAVSSAHRAESFAAIVDLVDTVKEKLPVWKRQEFTDGSDEWVGSA